MRAGMGLVYQHMLTVVKLARWFDLTLTGPSRVIARARNV